MSQRNVTSGKRSISDMEATFLFAHQTNIEKYKKILATDLPDHERRFVQRRLAEEQADLQQFTRLDGP